VEALAGVPSALEIAALGVSDAMAIDRPSLVVLPATRLDIDALEATRRERRRAYAPAGAPVVRGPPRTGRGEFVRVEPVATAQVVARLAEGSR
jgi:hypothetical protein